MEQESINEEQEQPSRPVKKSNSGRRKLIQLILLVVTVITTTIAGAEWMHGKSIVYSEGFTWEMVVSGLQYSIPFLLVLTIHEFGHYLIARYYDIKVTLPFYIPLWFPSLVPPIGTAGAFIQIRSVMKSTREYFDVGIAGPLAGFVAALILLVYGFTHLPSQDYVFNIHPEYKGVLEKYGWEYSDVSTSVEFIKESAYYQDSVAFTANNPDEVYERVEIPKGQFQVVALGSNLLFKIFENTLVKDKSLMPNQFEMIHYPFLFAGFLSLFFTALNLLPIGQLDGGHILYGLVGRGRHNIASQSIFLLFLGYAGIGISNPYMMRDELIWAIPFHVLILYVLTSGLRRDMKNRWMIIAILFAFQHLSIMVFPNIEGYPGWLLFIFLLSRVLGIYHPPALMEQPLSRSRQVLGWISLIIFLLCFSPQPFQIVNI